MKFCTESKYGESLTFFIYKDNVYLTGAKVELSNVGQNAMAKNHVVLFVTLEDHYFSCQTERWVFRIRTKNNCRGFIYDCYGENIDEYIDCVYDNPIENSKEYFDFLNEYKKTQPKGIAVEEYYAAVERVEREMGNKKYTTNDVPSLFKDWEIPSLIIGWIIFYILSFLLYIFAQFSLHLTLQVILSTVFFIWRKQKIYGIQ